MAVVMRAEVALSAQNQLKPGLAAAARDLERFRQLQARATQLSSRAASVTRGQEMMDRAAGVVRAGAGALGIAGIGAAAAKSVTQFAEFERGMTRIGVTGEATRERVVGASVDLRNMAYEMAMPIKQLSEGLDSLTASGMEFEESMKALPSIAKTAQASGAAVAAMATSTQAMMEHFKISTEQIPEAQDILAKGGKLGKFELKDMSRYLPSLLPLAKAYGLSGIEGIKQFTAYAQTIRSGTGTAEEAATSMADLFGKMEMEGTVKNFKDMGIDLPKHMAKARKEGKELLGVLVELTKQATKGDLSLINQLFPDKQASTAMRAILSNPGKVAELLKDLKGAAGTVNADFARVLGDTQASVDRTSESFDRLTVSLGGFAAASAVSIGATDQMQEAAKRLEGATSEVKQRGLLRTIVNVPQKSDSIVGDIAAEIGRNLKEIGPGKIDLGFGPAPDPRELEAIRADMRRLDAAKVNSAQFPPGSAAARIGATSDRNAREKLANRVTGPVIAAMTGMPEQFTLSASDPLGLGASVPKAAAVVSEVSKIGPAGQQAAAQVAAGADLFRSRWFGAIADVEQRLSGMRVPGGFGAGGGFNTGKSMREIE